MPPARLLLALLALPACATARPPAEPPRATAPEHAGGGSGLEELRDRVLRERVGLSDEKARRVEAVLNRHAPERRRLSLAMRDAHRALDALVARDASEQSEYQTVLDDLRRNRKALHALTEQAFGEVEAELTPSEQARLFLALEGHLRRKATEPPAH